MLCPILQVIILSVGREIREVIICLKQITSLSSPLGVWFPLRGTVPANIFLIVRRHMLCELQTEPMWIDVSVKNQIKHAAKWIWQI